MEFRMAQNQKAPNTVSHLPMAHFSEGFRGGKETFCGSSNFASCSHHVLI